MQQGLDQSNPHEVKWTQDTSKVGLEQAGTWSVRITDRSGDQKHDSLLFQFEVVILAPRQLSKPGAFAGATYAWPTTSSVKWLETEPSDDILEATEAVFLSADNIKFQSSILTWSPEDPRNFYIDGQYAAKLDLSGDEWLNFDVTVLLKHGEYYQHAFTAPLSVVQCETLISIDVATLPRITGKDDDEAMATSTVFTNGHDKMEVQKSVIFAFKKADSV